MGKCGVNLYNYRNFEYAQTIIWNKFPIFHFDCFILGHYNPAVKWLLFRLNIPHHQALTSLCGHLVKVAVTCTARRDCCSS